MNVVFSRAVAQQLKEKYLVLELETFEVGDKTVETFCVVAGDKIPFDEMPTLKHYEQLHQTFIDELNKKNYSVCQELITHLTGRFGGELDSFYSVIRDRIKTLV